MDQKQKLGSLKCMVYMDVYVRKKGGPLAHTHTWKLDFLLVAGIVLGGVGGYCCIESSLCGDEDNATAVLAVSSVARRVSSFYMAPWNVSLAVACLPHALNTPPEAWEKAY